jgi:hypothetical protein
LKKRKNFYKGAIMRFISELSFFAFPKGRVLLGFLAVLLTFPACQNPSSNDPEDTPSPAGKILDHITVNNPHGVYRVGQKPQLKITPHYTDGTAGSEVEQEGTVFTTNTDGNQGSSFSVTYNGKTGTYTAVVKDISFTKFPASVTNSLDSNLTRKPLNCVSYSFKDNQPTYVVGNNSKIITLQRISTDWGDTATDTTVGSPAIFSGGSNSTGIRGIVAAKIGQQYKYVAVGVNNTDGKIASSEDLATWTAVPLSTGQSFPEFTSVAFGNNYFVAVGGTVMKKRSATATGTTWEDGPGNTDPFTGQNTINCVIFAEGKFVAVGTNGKVAYISTNDNSWTPVNSGLNVNIKSIAYGNGTYVVVGNNGKIAYSTNLQSGFTSVTNSTFNSTQINSVAYGDGLFVAVGNDGKIARSINGETWVLITTNAFNKASGGGKENINAITYGGDECRRFVAVGDNCTMAYSCDEYANP